LGAKINDFGRLVEKEIPRLRRYAVALTRNMSRADDLVQDTLVRAIAKQRYWQCGTNLRAWLFTIMHNQNVNVVRRSVREGIAVEVDDTWPFLIAPTDPTAALSLRDLDRALARIPEQQRQVILLIGLEGTSYEEAATILDVPVGTIRSRLSRGRDSLRTLMDRRDGTEGDEQCGYHRRRAEAPTLRSGICANSDFLSGADTAPAASTDATRRAQPQSRISVAERLGPAAVTAVAARASTAAPDLASPA